MRTLQLIDRGTEEFSGSLSFQEQILAAKTADRSLNDMLIMVEHEPVYTVGRSVPFQKPEGLSHEVPWFEISRGGQATFHGPGQLVAYPIFDLRAQAEAAGRIQGGDVHVYLRQLEEVVVRCLQTLGYVGFARTGLTGVWVQTGGTAKKVASLGIGVRKWLSYHGLALNVTTDLSYFRAISACGQDGDVVTSLAEIAADCGRETPSFDSVKQALRDAFLHVFQLQLSPQTSSPSVDVPGKLVRPKWLKVKAPGSPEFLETQSIVKKLRLHTVCEEARCPNMGECWSHHTATFMIMGDQCTRRCSFCSVKDGVLQTLSPLDALEPFRVGKAVHELGLEHVVITSVNRDDVDDMGAEHFHLTVEAIRRQAPKCRIELLIPDMQGRKPLLETILKSGAVSVLNHNVETVPRLYREVRPGANFKRSLSVLNWAKELHSEMKTKSGVMVGLGETPEEVLEVMDALRLVHCDILTVGQYLQPTAKQLAVKSFVSPDQFAFYEREGYRRGFSHVESGPLVRSSYHAWKHSAPPGSDPHIQIAAAV